MKKLFIISSLLAAITASSALAKTEGSSVGLSILKSEVTHRSSLNKTPHDDHAFGGVSLNYKYAIPVANNIYVAPGVSYDRIGTTANLTGVTNSDKVSINNRFNVRADIGYDVNETLAAYGVVGYSAVGYENYNHNGSYSEKRNAYQLAPLWGVGFKTAISKSLDLTLEYTTQHADLHTSNSGEKIKTRLATYGIGLAYNF